MRMLITRNFLTRIGLGRLICLVCLQDHGEKESDIARVARFIDEFLFRWPWSFLVIACLSLIIVDNAKTVTIDTTSKSLYSVQCNLYIIPAYIG